MSAPIAGGASAGRSSAGVAALEFRNLVTASELAAMPPFEQRIWGGESELVSVNMLVATISEGGMAIGAFDDGALVGVVYGFATHEPLVLHSHYLAVDPAYRRIGLGVELKQRQRTWCLSQGITHMRWTYDPLQLGNAHLNLRVLGARGVSYHLDHYGSLGGINGSLPSDRVTVCWDLHAVAVPDAAAGSLAVDVPAVSADEIAASAPAAHAARDYVREQMRDRIGNGWVLVDIDRDSRRYWLARTG